MRQIKSFLLLAASQGGAIFLWALFTSSESGSTIFLWFSLTRLILLAVIGLLCLLLFVLVTWLWRSPNKIQALLQKLDYWCIQKKRLVLSLIVLTVLFFVISVPTLKIITMPLDYDIYGSWAPYTFPLLYYHL